jgi:hypothetical protein
VPRASPSLGGCQPAYLPVVLGGLALMLREAFNLNGVQGTMHGVAPLMMVHGPYAQQIGLHGGSGCFGPGFRANATIGRAIRLMLLNLGGGIPGLAWSCTCPLRINTAGALVNYYRDKKVYTRGFSWHPSSPCTPRDALKAGRADTRPRVSSPQSVAPSPALSS